ncbi:MAG TPA: helix-turn-helix domain-containing protein, partial [Actinopolymorphaceae bacterium]|nr:helix-turn-helix domain-containing protein [Actinopolymorphaceae bacterium]
MRIEWTLDSWESIAQLLVSCPSSTPKPQDPQGKLQCRTARPMVDREQVRPRRVRMRDVALRAGVSAATVSRALNNRSTVDPTLAERVRRV